jgi:hypothetical protein
MSRFKMLGATTVLAIAGCIATAQTAVTNVFENINKVIPNGQATGVSGTENLTFAGPGMVSIADVQVALTIAKGYNGDFYGYLVHDSGFSVLPNRVGRSGGNLFGYSDAGMDVTLSASGNDIHKYQSSSPDIENGQLTGTRASDGRDIDPESVLDTDSQTSLLGSFNGTNQNGAWTLFLADLDFGQEGTLVKWGVIVTAVPEPSTWMLIGLGGSALGMRSLRSRVSK